MTARVNNYSLISLNVTGLTKRGLIHTIINIQKYFEIFNFIYLKNE